MKKKQALELWNGMKRRRKIEPDPIPYKQRGTKYGEDTIRITGTRKFIEAVLSNLTDLCGYENTDTRLQISWQQATDKNTRKLLDSWVCYIQVHERGSEAKAINNAVSARAGRQIIVSSGC